MPVGLVITAALMVLGVAVSLWPPSRSGRLGLIAWLVSAIPNESPFLAFYWVGGSTLLAYSQGDLRGGGMWAALALAAAPLAAAPVLVRRSLRATPRSSRRSDGRSSHGARGHGCSSRRCRCFTRA